MLQHGDRLTVENVTWLMQQVKAQGLAKRFDLSLSLNMVKRGLALYCTTGTQTAIALNALVVSQVDCDLQEGEVNV